MAAGCVLPPRGEEGPIFLLNWTHEDFGKTAVSHVLVWLLVVGGLCLAARQPG